MTDAEKVRKGEALIRDVATFLATEPNESDRVMARELYQGLDSILTELAEATEARDDAREVNRKLMKANSEWRVAHTAAEERAEKAESEVARYRSFCGEALCGDIERDRDAFAARIQELEAENDRLRQGLVEALEEQP